jgi:uncharacterized protein YdiU (UPF0061 family)
MPKKQMLKLEYSYLSLPDKFYQLVKPTPFVKPELVLINNELQNQLNISIKKPEDVLSLLVGNESSFAQAYAGHQFGGFTKLGDGRAIVMGEYITPENERIDIQLKGSGRTLYSRGGDGKATLKAMLREYLISEAIHHLKIPSSRSLFVAKTGEAVKRERENDGAVVARLMKSHIRIGTFEYARHFGSTEDLKSLIDYTINRLYPEISQAENPVLAFLQKVMSVQIELVVNWMRVGFIHGVMNTDNVSISGETFDYGPCAFMNTYHPDTVYSSIDTNGRYAFGNQTKITKWNIARFAEALLPVLHPDSDKALQLAQACIDSFDSIWNEKYYQMMLLKLGIENPTPEQYPLVDELLKLMQTLRLDYTNTFLAFSYDTGNGDISLNGPEFKPWLVKWQNIMDSSNGVEQARKTMIANNPAFIPRNHLVEEALDAAVDGNSGLLEKLLLVLRKPYQYQENMGYYTAPPSQSFENRYATYCGT